MEFACTPVPALFTKLVTCPGEKQRESLGQRIRWNLTEMPAHAPKGRVPSSMVYNSRALERTATVHQPTMNETNCASFTQWTFRATWVMPTLISF